MDDKGMGGLGRGTNQWTKLGLAIFHVPVPRRFESGS